MDDTTAYIIAMVIEPCVRTSWIEDHWDADYIIKAKKVMLDLMHQYHSQLPQEARVDSQPRLLEDFDAIAARLCIKDMGGCKNSCNVHTVEDEYRSYTSGALTKQGEDPLKFWDANLKTYLILFMIAMDHLPIQGSSVPCERVFSSSVETDTKKRNRISSLLMKALQMLKYNYKKKQLNFSERAPINQWDMMDEP